MKTEPRIGITLGSLDGIGPEVVSSALASLPRSALDRVVILGSLRALEAAREVLGDERSFDPGRLTPTSPAELAGASAGPLLIDPAPLPVGFCPAPGQGPRPELDAAPLAGLELAARLAEDGLIGAVVTAPIDKRVLTRAARAPGEAAFKGQTEFFASRSGAEEVLMVMANRVLSVGILTTHLPLREVSAALNEPRILAGARLLHRFLEARAPGRAPRMALAGLNPHLGDEGLAGDEDQLLLAPAAERLRAEGIDLRGPISSESVFWRARDGAFDGVLALYHDQAMIPVRLLDFDHTVNVTVGLPYWRVSPDHGVAYDLAWRGRARADSCFEAIELALDLAGTPPGGGDS